MNPVRSFCDFRPLEEIVIGRAANYHVPPTDLSMRHFFGLQPDHVDAEIDRAHLVRVAEEAEEDLDELATTLTSLGVKVRRPQPADHSGTLSLLDWTTTASHALMPRDCLLVIGERIIEAPMPVRARYAETFPYRSLLREYFDGGALWVAAPKPQLPDQTYRFTADGNVLAEIEPLFDAANVIRCGTDVFFNVSNTGNRVGARWLARLLGSEFRVHEVSLCDDHVGTTLHLLRPGLLLANAARLGADDIPVPLSSWRTLWFDDPADDGYGLDWARASTWIGMNILSVDEETVIVPKLQVGLARLLEREGFTVIGLPYRHGRTFGGGFHCCSLDVRRGGGLESYL
jgi:N-dimethylarginine dimethylaminohydrolase